MAGAARGPWMPLHEAEQHAGSFEAMLPHLREGRILARHGGLYFWREMPDGGREIEVHSGPGYVTQESWARARKDPETGRVIFATSADWADLLGQFELFAIDVEFERAAVESLLPTAAAIVGGSDPIHDWEAAARHVDAYVANPKHGLLPRRKDGEPIKAKAIDLMWEYFEAKKQQVPQTRSFYRWFDESPQRWRAWFGM